MKIPLTYNLRSVRQRPVSTALTALGIGLVVAVFIGMLALANGFAAALTRTGSDSNVLVLRKGADSELSSGLDRDAVSTLTASPHIARGADGRALVSPELYVVIPLGRHGRHDAARQRRGPRRERPGVAGAEQRHPARRARGPRRARTRSASASGWSVGSPTPGSARRCTSPAGRGR